MKKRVRIYKPVDQWKAQMGGYQAAASAAPQTQLTDEDLISATVKMLAQGSQPQEVLNTLMDNGIEEQKATQAVKYSVDYIKAAQDEEYSDVESDEQAQQDQTLEEAAAERQAIEAQEEAARQSRMQEMYDLTEDNTTQDYSDDEEAMMDMMRYGGLPSKRTFIKNSVKLAKKQMGGQEPQSNRADNTDTGDRQAKLQKFVGSLQNHANEALMKEDAEAAYNQMQMMQPQIPFMPMAQEGGEQQLSPKQQRQMARQQKQIGRQMNRMIGNIPVGLYNNRAGGLPTNIGVINMPAIGTEGLQSLMGAAAGMQNYLPAMGSVIGGPKLANIDVRKTGLFGRPKQYSITFAQDVVTNPTTAENVVKQEVKNIEEEAKDVEEKVTTAAEDVKKADEAVKAETAAATKSSSGTGTKKSGTSTAKKTTATKALPGSASYTDAQVQAEMERVNQKFLNASNLDRLDMMQQLISSKDFDTNPYLQAIYQDWYKTSGLQLPVTAEFPAAETQTGMNWLEQNYKNSGVKSVSEVLNSRNVPVVKAAAKPQSTIPKNMVVSYPYYKPAYPTYQVPTSLFQQGGFTDQNSGLYKFVYGGNDMYQPPIPGKITDDPYFQYGGLKRYAEGDEVTDTETTTTTAAKTPDYSINPMTGKPWTESEWAMASKLLGTIGTQATTDTTTDTTASTDQGATNTGYNYGYNTGVGPIYPPLFGGGRGRGLQNLLSLTPFGANPLATYAGTWAQQKGLPIDPATGQPYTGAFANPQIAKIDVRKSSMFGRPKKYSIDYMVDDVAGTSSFLNPEDYPGGVNPGATSTIPLPGTTAATTTSDGLAIDPATGEPLPVGRDIKNLKLKSFMSRIPGVRNMINWGDAAEMTPEEEAAFKYESEVARNVAAEERGDITAPPIPEDKTTTLTPAQANPMLLQKMQMQQNIADEESGDLVAPGMSTSPTIDERSYLVERMQEPMMEGLPTGTPEEIRAQLAQQQALSPSSFAEYQAGPVNIMSNQEIPDEYLGNNTFDLSTQTGFDRQQYLNEALGREQLDATNRPSIGRLPINTVESFSGPSLGNLRGQSMEEIQRQIDAYKQKQLSEIEAQKAAATTNQQSTKKSTQAKAQPKKTVKQKTGEELYADENRRLFETQEQDRLKAIKLQNQIKDWNDWQKSDLDINTYLKLQKAGRLPYQARQYGGISYAPYNLFKAYDGVQTPVSGDPRFGASYDEMMRNIADEESGLLVPPPIPGEPTAQTAGMKPIEFGDVAGVRENAAYSDKMFGTNYTEDYGLNKPGRKKVTVNYKNKNMWTIDPLVGLEAGLAGAKGLTRFLNTRDERKREKELAQSLTADSVYGSRSNMDKGTYDINSGLFRQNQMGFTGVAKYGGAQFKQGGTTYMSAAQVKKFLEEGGELEFV